MEALALEHLGPDPIGIFGEVLEERGIGVDRVQLQEGHAIPDWRRYDLIVAMGAAASVWEEDEYPWLASEKKTIREAALAGLPYFGVCFGAQLLAAVFGARSYKGPEPELGANQIFLTAAAQRDPVFRGFPPDLEVFEWHSNHFDLPPGAIRLARSPRYENQAIRYGRVAYGIQCHLEPSAEDIRVWFDAFPSLSQAFETRHGPGSVEAFFAEYATFVPFLQETARRLFGRWLENALALGGLSASARAVRGWRGAGRERRLGGRERECSRIDAAVRTAREGGSAVVVLRGESGIGKTALLDYAVATADGLSVLRTAGKDTEQERPFTGLGDLCRPLVEDIARLRPARAGPLAAALGLAGDAVAGDRFAVYAGVLDLLTTVAYERPLLLAVDDAHLLDDASAEAVRFVAQHLGADGIALLVGTEADEDFPDLEEVRLGGLDRPAARALLEARFGDQLASDVADAVVEAARGNPLALLEIPPGLTLDQQAGREPIETLPSSVEWAFLGRIAGLPPEGRSALVVAALAEDGDLEAVGRACAALGIDASALDTAERAGLVRSDDGRLTFRHGLVRTAVAYSALRADRRNAHAALAGIVGGDARLWHLARAAAGPDEDLAAGLERAAWNARERRAHAAAARGLELAAQLTPDAEVSARRLLGAAESAHQSGHAHAALNCLEAALRRASAEDLRLDIEHMLGRVAARSGSAARARDGLLAAAVRCETHDPAKAAELLADAVLPCLRAGAPLEACRVARRSMQLAHGMGGRAELLATVMLGTALLFTGDYAAGAELLDRAGERVSREELAGDGQLRAYVGAGLAYAGRHEPARTLLGSVIEQARAEGAVGALPYALVRLAGVELAIGRWAAAAGALHEALRLAEETGHSADHGLALGTLAWLEAAKGEAESCRAHVDDALELAGRLGRGSQLDRAAAALGLLELGLGHPDAAIPHLEHVHRLQEEQGWSDASVAPHVSPDLVEAYVLDGRREDPAAVSERFSADAERSRRPSALAAAARCRAFLSDESQLDTRFAEALAAREEVTGPFERARTSLLYGTRLAASGRRDAAGAPLNIALATFEHLGAEPWAERARREIIRIGSTPPGRKPRPLDRLTSQELEVVLATAEGAYPREVATRLFLGLRTVQLHLLSAVVKLDLSSPTELAGAISGRTPPAAR